MYAKAALLLSIALLAFALAPSLARAVTITEFFIGLSSDANPQQIAPGHDGNVWFVETNNRRIGRVTPEGAINEFPMDVNQGEPVAITPGPGGVMWFTQLAQGMGAIGTIGATGGVTTHFGLTGSPVRIAAGPDGNAWFTESNGRIGRITPFAEITEFSQGISSNPALTSITAGPDGNLWFTEFLRSRIGRITPGGSVTEFANGITPNSGLREIVSGPDGDLWFINKGWLARITTSGVVTELPVPSGITTGLRDIAFGRDGNLWWVAGNRVGRRTPDGRVREFTAGLSQNADGESIAAGPDGNLWVTEFSANRIARVRLDPPTAQTGSPADITTSTATLTGTVDPRAEPTTYSFEFGVTTSGENRTAAGDAGDGDAAVSVSAPISGLSPETTYRYRLVAESPAGTTRGDEQLFTTAVNLDRDGDGFNRPQDCVDQDSRVHPGAFDRPQNGLNEDCVDGDADYPFLPSRIVANVGLRGNRAFFRKLSVRPVLAGSRVQLRCVRRCRYKRKRISVRRDAGRVSLKRQVRRLRLAKRSVFEVRVTRPETIGVARRWDFKSLANPKTVDLCVRPGGRRQRCPF